ncbi:Pimeloyl-ACP methyl ester carboxylesterase [Cellulomonas marina]|uniref:Pimeloyl-ACP methyl ester carboxylesterase n=1 Tax=Cellulomonas marina TaxID=988821 RepID=A0A1I0XP23_9CELL|nr:Pimeloyl-ACP methyl ester carboxylesterase [Cellulomonas marina]
MPPGVLPVVLLHGMRTSGTMWRAQREALERLGIPVAAPDLPGHGTRLHERFTLENAFRAVDEAVAGLGRPVLLVGLSLGGYVGAAWAARRPGAVAGLVAASCSTRPLRPVVGGWTVAAHGFARLPDRGAGINQWLVDRTLPASAAVDVGAGGFALDVVADALRAVGTLRPLEDLAALEVPVWLVNGRFDHFRGEERRFLAACRDGRLVVVPGSTHLVSLVRPVAFTRAVLDAHAEVAATLAARSANGPAQPARGA